MLRRYLNEHDIYFINIFLGYGMHVNLMKMPKSFRIGSVRSCNEVIHCCNSDAIVVSFSQGTDVLEFLPKRLTAN